MLITVQTERFGDIASTERMNLPVYGEEPETDRYGAEVELLNHALRDSRVHTYQLHLKKHSPILASVSRQDTPPTPPPVQQ